MSNPNKNAMFTSYAQPKKKKNFEKVLQIVVLVIKNMFSFFNDYNGQLD